MHKQLADLEAAPRCMLEQKERVAQNEINLEESGIDQLGKIHKIDEKLLNVRLMNAVPIKMNKFECENNRVNIDENSWLIEQENSNDQEIKNLENVQKNKDIDMETLCKFQASNCMNEIRIINDSKESVIKSINLNYVELENKVGEKEKEIKMPENENSQHQIKIVELTTKLETC